MTTREQALDALDIIKIGHDNCNYDGVYAAIETIRKALTRPTYTVTKEEAVEMLDDFYRIDLERFIWKHKTTVAKLIKAAAKEQE